MSTYQNDHFITSLPNGWTSQTLPDNICLWQREEDTWVIKIQYEDMGEMSGDTLKATMTSIYTSITLEDGSILLPVGDVISLTDGVLNEYRKGTDVIELENQTYWVIYGGMRVHIASGRLLRFYCQFFYQQGAVQNLEVCLSEMLSVLENITFIENQVAQPLVSPLTQKLLNTRLHFMESYNSGQGGGGYSIEEIIDLRINQQFSYKYTHITSAYSSGGFSLGGGYTDNKGEGTWHILPDKDLLVLEFTDGTEMQLDMIIEKGIIWLNNRKFFWERLNG